jgi:hypothetical protein
VSPRLNASKMQRETQRIGHLFTHRVGMIS